MAEFDDIRKRADELGERQQEAGAESAEVQPEEKERGPLYWLLRNLTVGLATRYANFWKKRPILAFLFTAVLIWLAITGRSAYQPGFIFIRKYMVLAVFVLIAFAIMYRTFRRSQITGKVVTVLVGLGIAVGVWFYGAPMVNYLALYYHYQSVPKVGLSELPVTGNERIQPLNSISTLASQEAIDETESATLPHFVRRQDGGFDFSMGVGPSPDYLLQRLTRNVYEVISVSGTAPAPDFSGTNRHEVDFDVGEKLLFSKNVYVASIKRFNIGQFFNYQPDEVRFLEDDEGNWKQVVSLVKWKGFLFPRPVFGGVLVIEPRDKGFGAIMGRIIAGEGIIVHPNEIDNYDWLNGQNLVPEKVSRFTAESFRFHEGFLAPFPGYHEGDIRIPVLPQDQNAMPFITWFDFEGVADAESALYNYFGLEPYQESKQGLNMSVFIAGDGAETVYYFDHAASVSGLTGSSAIPVKVRESRKNYDWNNNVPVESRPFIRDVGGKRRFFWLTTVVTKSDREGEGFIGGSIPDVTLTDALKKQVVWVEQRSLGDSEKWESQLEEELHMLWEDFDLPEEETELQSETTEPVESVVPDTPLDSASLEQS